jgi:hypothetical protein
MIRTTDVSRSVRWSSMLTALLDWPEGGELALEYLDNADGQGSNQIRDRDGIIFYLTGMTHIPGLDTIGFRPGALADHLTSYGGMLTDSSQMSVLAWLEAGATASYGTAIEPCNYVAKFPHPRWLIRAYREGRTAIEAYWGAVEWPGEGVFVGEPLSRPWRPHLTWDGASITILTTGLTPGPTYGLIAADKPDGPWRVVRDDLVIDAPATVEVVVTEPDKGYYRVLRF